MPKFPRVLVAWMAVASLSGCSMSTQWFVQKSLRDAGFSRAEARCAVDGVTGQLSPDQLSSLRLPLINYLMLHEPPGTMNADQLLEWLGGQVTPEVHQVLSRQAARCRATPAASQATNVNASVAHHREFNLSADQLYAAWRTSLQPEEREAEQEGTSPPGMDGPFFSAANCRWIEPDRRASCRYRVSRGAVRPGRERHWVDESAELQFTGNGWSFGG